MNKLSKLQKCKQFLADHYQFRIGDYGKPECRLCLHSVVIGDWGYVNFPNMWYLVAHQMDIATLTVKKAIRELAIEQTAAPPEVYPESKR